MKRKESHIEAPHSPIRLTHPLDGKRGLRQSYHLPFLLLSAPGDISFLPMSALDRARDEGGRRMNGEMGEVRARTQEPFCPVWWLPTQGVELESLMCVTSLCLFGTTHTHKRRRHLICSMNDPWRLKRKLQCEHITTSINIPDLNWILHSCPHNVGLNLHTTLNLTLVTAGFFCADSHTCCCWWYSRMHRHHAVTRQPASAAPPTPSPGRRAVNS